jgi:phage gpG-like protein
MAGNLRDLQRLLDRAANEIPTKALRIIGVEGKRFIQKNFRDEAFTDTTTKNWKARKLLGRGEKDLTKYRTNRRGREGSLTRFGRENEGRAILVGFNTGGDKLKNSFSYSIGNQRVVFRTYKGYAEFHNEGTDELPQRQFIGKSAYLDKQIGDKITRELNTILR